MGQKGQLSLEYLILLVAILSAFAVLLPVMNGVYNAGLFGLDSVNAKGFAFSMQEAIGEIGFQADGASTMLEARPFGKWLVFGSGKDFVVIVQSQTGKEKRFTVKFPNNVWFSKAEIGSKTAFYLRKDSGKILLEYS